jgi:hypothetical protein
MTQPPFDLGLIDTSVGPAVVMHRGALAVEPRDGLTGRAAMGVRVGRETARSRFDLTRRRRGGPLDRAYPAVPLEAAPGSRFLLRYTASVRPTVTIRLDGLPGRWVRRRFTVAVRPLSVVAAADPLPPPAPTPPGPYVPVASRLLLPSLLPGAAYPLPRGTTGVRFRVTRAGTAVPWTRVLAFGTDGSRIGWGHGDEHGEVVVVIAGIGTAVPPEPGRFDVALRVLAPPPGPAPADAPLEPVPLFGAAGPDPDVMSGVAPPPGYAPAPDRAHRCTVGELAVLPDHVLGGP